MLAPVGNHLIGDMVPALSRWRPVVARRASRRTSSCAGAGVAQSRTTSANPRGPCLRGSPQVQDRGHRRDTIRIENKQHRSSVAERYNSFIQAVLYNVVAQIPLEQPDETS